MSNIIHFPRVSQESSGVCAFNVIYSQKFHKRWIVIDQELCECAQWTKVAIWDVLWAKIGHLQQKVMLILAVLNPVTTLLQEI